MNRSYSKIRAMQELNLIAESRFITERKKYKSLISEAYSAQPGEGYDGGVEACKKELPYNVVTKAGKNWNEAKKAWGSTGTAQDNLALRDAWCQGWRPGDAKDGGTGTPTEQKPGEQQGTVPGSEQKPGEQLGTVPGTEQKPGEQLSGDKQYSEEYIAPTFGQQLKAD